jgi:hypothetical protein
MESRRPYTQSERYQRLVTAETNCRRQAEEESSGTPRGQTVEKGDTSSLTNNKRDEKEPAGSSSPDGYDCSDELRVIARARAYFEIAFERAQDIVPMIIDNEFIVGLSVDLQKNLIKNLELIGNNGQENCARYCVEEPDIKEKRAALTRKLKVLADATELLDRVG